MKSQKGFAILEGLLIILILAVVGFGGYYVWHNQQSKTKPASAAQTTSQKTTDATSGWNTYSDTSAGYSIKIPKDWEFVKSQPQKLSDGTIEKDYQGNPIMTPDAIRPVGQTQDSVDGIWTVVTDTSNLNPKDYFVQNGAGRANYIDGQGTTSTINGYADFSVSMNGQSTTKVVTLANKGKIVEFAYYTNSLNKHLDICNEIVGSIKFL